MKPNFEKMKINEKLFFLRIKNRYSQKYVANKIEVSQVAYCKWENGKTSPNIKNVSKLSSFYEIDFNDLLDENISFNLKSMDIKNTYIQSTLATVSLIEIASKLEKVIDMIGIL